MHYSETVMHATLVTGAPGWLGARLLEVLCNPSDPLQRHSGVPATERQMRALVLPGINTSSLPGGAELIEGNVLKPETLAPALRGITTVFHCVGLIHPKKISELFTVNVEGTKNMLKAAADAGIKRFVYVSSNSAGGINRSHGELMKEEDPPRPYMAYGQSKLEAEETVQSYQAAGMLETVILRPCWFYGPGRGQPERQLRFFRMIQEGNPILFGDGRNLRSMSYLDHTIQGMLLAEKVSEANGRIYWIADARPYTTIEIYETIARIFGILLRPRRLPGFASLLCRQIDHVLQGMNQYITEFHVAGEMDRDIACDIAKAQRELGYRPETTLEEGMRRSIDWARTYQGLEI